MVKISITEQCGWRKIVSDNVVLYLKGYIHNKAPAALLKDFDNMLPAQVENYLFKLNGDFALVVQTENLITMAVDKIRSIPLFWMDKEIRATAAELVRSKGGIKLNKHAALSIQMSGYTIGEDSVYQELNSLIAGQYAVFQNNKVERKSYYQYYPYPSTEERNYKKELSLVTLNSLRKMIEGLDGRQVVIPLSAGNDSRLVASGLKHLGYTNVKCYSYGIKGTFEAKVARVVAKKLGYEFKFIPLTTASERGFYESQEFQDYLEFSDSYTAVPYFQSLSTISRLQDWIEDDAVFVNGNTGDFISGGHIPLSLQRSYGDLSPRYRSDLMLQEAVDKHFSLWGYLKTDKNLKNIRDQLLNSIPEQATVDEGYGAYEYLEFINRQSKYVVSGQRSYEFYGYEWRLPLWSDEYLHFWQRVPLELKSNQQLYVDMLKDENWANVWGDDILVNDKNIRPLWIVPLRFLAKIPFALLGKRRWHQFERGFFYYFMDVTKMICIKRYFSVVKDALKQPRNHVSWQVEDYIKSKR